MADCLVVTYRGPSNRLSDVAKGWYNAAGLSPVRHKLVALLARSVSIVTGRQPIERLEGYDVIGWRIVGIDVTHRSRFPSQRLLLLLWNRRSVGSASEVVSIMAHEAKQQTSIECYSAVIVMWIGCLTGIFFVFFQCEYGVGVYIGIEHRFLLLLMAFHHLYIPTAALLGVERGRS